jgi:hypothetical protein
LVSIWANPQPQDCQYHRYCRQRHTLLAAALRQAIWIGIMAAFLLSRAAYGLRYASALAKEADAEAATIIVPEPELPKKRPML